RKMMKMHQIPLAHPERSWRRKMSPKTTISSQIQMKNRKNQRNDQNTCPVPNSANSMSLPPSQSGPHVRSPWSNDDRRQGGQAPPAEGWNSYIPRSLALAATMSRMARAIPPLDVSAHPDHPRWGGAALLPSGPRCLQRPVAGGGHGDT